MHQTLLIGCTIKRVKLPLEFLLILAKSRFFIKADGGFVGGSGVGQS